MDILSWFSGDRTLAGDGGAHRNGPGVGLNVPQRLWARLLTVDGLEGLEVVEVAAGQLTGR